MVPGAAIETAGGVKGLEASLGLRCKVPLPWKAESWERSGGRMPVREFANQKALIDYAERNGLVNGKARFIEMKSMYFFASANASSSF